MRKIFAIVRRELVERVRTKAFLIGTFLLPVVIVGMMVIPTLLMTGTERTKQIAIVDGTSANVGAQLEAGLGLRTFRKSGEDFPRYDIALVRADGRVEAIRDSLVAITGWSREAMPGTLDGVLVITDETIETGDAAYLGGDAGSLEGISDLQRALSNVLMQTRLSSAGVDPAIVGRALTPADLETRKVTDGRLTGESGTASFLLAYAMGFLLYFGIFFYGQQTATSVIEEKNSRIMEVLASSLTPFQMLLGKIVGVGLTGLLQLAIWGGVMFIALSRRAQIAGLFGADPATVAALPLPSFPPDLLVIFLLYFVLGFMIYGALFAAVGSMVNTVQEMQQFLFPVMMLIIFAFLGMFAVLKDPTAGIGVTFSFIPFFAPIVMPVRWSMASVPMGQLLLSLATMVAGVLAVAWLAGRIYRTGILMYGKKPTVREVFRWIKAG
jgi:ABC-2 type transport system permease protein